MAMRRFLFKTQHANRTSKSSAIILHNIIVLIGKFYSIMTKLISYNRIYDDYQQKLRYIKVFLPFSNSITLQNECY